MVFGFAMHAVRFSGVLTITCARAHTAAKSTALQLNSAPPSNGFGNSGLRGLLCKNHLEVSGMAFKVKGQSLGRRASSFRI